MRYRCCDGVARVLPDGVAKRRDQLLNLGVCVTLTARQVCDHTLHPMTVHGSRNADVISMKVPQVTRSTFINSCCSAVGQSPLMHTDTWEHVLHSFIPLLILMPPTLFRP